MSEEPERQVEIDRKIGHMMGQFSTITTVLRHTLQREWELEQLAEEYYTLLSVVSEEHWAAAMAPFWNSRRCELQKQAEEQGIERHEPIGQ